MRARIRTAADVDCIGDGKPLCDKDGVRGFPTVKWGSPDDLQDYKGGRDFDALNTFAAELKPSCSVANVDACTDEQKETPVPCKRCRRRN